jgi:hypothetical protein
MRSLQSSECALSNEKGDMMKGFLIGLICMVLLVGACTSETQLEELPPPPEKEDVVHQVQSDQLEETIEKTEEKETPIDAKADLEKIFKMANVEFMVEYDWRSDMGTESVNGIMKLYMKGSKMRTDSTQTFQGDTMESQTFISEEEFITCSKQGTWTCMKIEAPEMEEMPTGLQEEYEAEGEAFWDAMSVFAAPDRRIAGTTAKCFLIEESLPDVGTVSQEVCYSAKGVPLYIEVKNPEGTMKQEATSYSTSVSDSSFTPPAEPQDMEDLMAQYADMGMAS